MGNKSILIARKLLGIARGMVASYQHVADVEKNQKDGDVIKWGEEDEWHHPMNGFTGTIDFGKTTCRVKDAYFTLHDDMVEWEKGWLMQGAFYGNWESGTNNGGTFIGGTMKDCDWMAGTFEDGIAEGNIVFHGGILAGGEITGAIIDGAKIKGAECMDCEFRNGKFLSGRWEGGKWLSRTEPEPPHDVDVVRATGNPDRPYQTSDGEMPRIEDYLDEDGGYSDEGGDYGDYSGEGEETGGAVFNDPTPLPPNTTRLDDTVDFHSELETAIRNHRMLRFNYMKRDGTVELIDFLPVELKTWRNDDEVCIGWKNGEEGNEEMKRTLHVKSMGDKNKTMEDIQARSLLANETDNVADIQQQLESAVGGDEYLTWLAETGRGTTFKVTGIPVQLRRYQQKRQAGYTEDILMCKFKATNGQEVTYGVKIHPGPVWKKPTGFHKTYFLLTDNEAGTHYTVEFQCEMVNEEGENWMSNGYYVQCREAAKQYVDGVNHTLKRITKIGADPEFLEENGERGRILVGYSYAGCGVTPGQASKMAGRLERLGFVKGNAEE